MLSWQALDGEFWQTGQKGAHNMGRVSKRTSAHTAAVKETKVGYKAGIYARLSSDQDKRKNEIGRAHV